MVKKIFKIVLSILVVLIGFCFWMSPRLGGLLNFGKDKIGTEIEKLAFDTIASGKYELVYQQQSNRSDYVALRTEYRLDSLISSCTSDFEKVVTIQSWVQGRWKHDGENRPEKNDALFILKEAEKGKRFRCVEYSIVAAQSLASLGFVVRSLSLMAKDISEVKSGGGHVANEVFLPDLQKWVFIDPQFDVITSYNGVPLNAVELQYCIAHQQNFQILNPNQTISKTDYEKWIGPYLYYFSTTLKGENIGIWDRIAGIKKQLTLMANGATEPAYFQNLIRINNSYYTNAVKEFYPVLKMN